MRAQRIHAEKLEWDTVWGSMDDSVREKNVYYIMDEIKIEYLRPLLPRSGRTLEVGCGAAHLSCFLAARGYQTVGLDYSDEALRVAQRNYSLTGVEGGWVTGDGYVLPFATNTFDVVLSAGLLEHFENPVPLLQEMIRVLRPGGVFYSDIVPQKFSLMRALDRFRLRKSGLYEASWKRETILAFLHKAGLREVTVFPAGVFLPLWMPLLARLRAYQILHARVTAFLRPLTIRLDSTRLADYLGFYYFCYGVKGDAT